MLNMHNIPIHWRKLTNEHCLHTLEIFIFMEVVALHPNHFNEGFYRDVNKDFYYNGRLLKNDNYIVKIVQFNYIRKIRRTN